MVQEVKFYKECYRCKKNFRFYNNDYTNHTKIKYQVFFERKHYVHLCELCYKRFETFIKGEIRMKTCNTQLELPFKFEEDLDNRSLVTEYTKLISKYERSNVIHPSILEITQKYMTEILKRMKK